MAGDFQAWGPGGLAGKEEEGKTQTSLSTTSEKMGYGHHLFLSQASSTPTYTPPKSGKNRLQAQMSCLSQHCPKLCPLPATLLRTRLHPWSLTVPSVFKQDPVLGRRARDSFRIFCLGWTKYWAGTQDTWIPIPLCRSLLT